MSAFVDESAAPLRQFVIGGSNWVSCDEQITGQPSPLRDAELEIIAVFNCQQDSDIWKNQGQVNEDDERLLAFQ
ncbi:hypothetical protein LOY70_08460 [Pseudomonas sp. B21-054]|uniref:hypothetical protein n=1 Tax=Pseudomonas sp. B21-054 TaxID=2895494 RepID=UPI0022319B65|nr:hypothetical protein [Pseudomonas sp. B21-054]UZE19616.1 hypothetical protein LOY70_08460 [Pseudomonas sp. B21-054]